MKVLDLFSGIGGFSLGLERAGMETVAFCEIEEFPRKVLAKHWPNVPIHRDIRELKGEQVGPVDVICGGYPCQPFSTAGKRAGKDDHRHLWPEYLRLIQELRPTWVIGENVAGHISMGLDDVLSDLEGEGYAWEAFVIPAVAVDAKHRRDRVWIVANTSAGRLSKQGEGKNKQSRRTETKRPGEAMADATYLQCNGSREYRKQGKRQVSEFRERGQSSGINRARSQWEPEPALGRVANGVPRRVDRLKALGNAVVPQIPEIIGRAIMAHG